MFFHTEATSGLQELGHLRVKALPVHQRGDSTCRCSAGPFFKSLVSVRAEFKPRAHANEEILSQDAKRQDGPRF